MKASTKRARAEANREAAIDRDKIRTQGVEHYRQVVLQYVMIATVFGYTEFDGGEAHIVQRTFTKPKIFRVEETLLRLPVNTTENIGIYIDHWSGDAFTPRWRVFPLDRQDEELEGLWHFFIEGPQYNAVVKNDWHYPDLRFDWYDEVNDQRKPEVRERLTRNFKSALGGIIAVHVLTGYTSDYHKRTLYFEEPALVRVRPTHPRKVFSWQDDASAKSVWNVDPVEKRWQYEDLLDFEFEAPGYTSEGVFEDANYSVYNSPTDVMPGWTLGHYMIAAREIAEKYRAVHEAMGAKVDGVTEILTRVLSTRLDDLLSEDVTQGMREHEHVLAKYAALRQTTRQALAVIGQAQELLKEDESEGP